MLSAAIIDRNQGSCQVELRAHDLDWSVREANLLRQVVYRITPRRAFNSLLNERFVSARSRFAGVEGPRAQTICDACRQFTPRVPR